LAFLGRISPEKCPDHAIEVAKRVGMPLRIAAKVDPADQAYFKQKIERLLDHPLVEYVGEINDAEKNDFLGEAAALICPYDWPEPFGLVLIEAMACGTPVLAYRQGSIPEIIDHGVTGYICDGMGEMTQAVSALPLIDRSRCREIFEKRFTVERMVRDYLAIYESVTAASHRRRLIPMLALPDTAGRAPSTASRQMPPRK
jgi:glycosyltransferase involved in cell wall biosynthesis